MDGFVSKVTRLAVSKAAGFSYAVAVGVAGNLAFHYVQPASPGPVAMTAPLAAPVAPTAPSPAVSAAPREPAQPEHVAAQPTGKPTRSSPAVALPVSLPEEKPVPPPAKPIATTTILPDPEVSAQLPTSANMPAPALKPTALPSEPIKATVAVGHEQSAPGPIEDASLSKPPAAPPLLPIGPAISLDQPPSPPQVAAAAPHDTSNATPDRIDVPTPPHKDSAGLELSDMWHPSRAVSKSLNWASDQLPDLGGDTPHTPPRVSRTAGPIPLVPAGTLAKDSENAADRPAKPSAPGPGSGGLY
ncbi:MAG: hypothetical protein JO001_22095 [Alphaproteobacteria bacterium]|nr:hypothetical protein [Alphaproteobacteria bacterium]